MPEQEDFNTFNSMDCGGATLMLGIAPVLISYVLLENMVLAITFGVIAVILAAVVYLLSLVTRWKIIPRIVDLLGMVLTPTYIAIAIWIWCGL